jgi:capsular exopolysaccharide synthesis family protein
MERIKQALERARSERETVAQLPGNGDFSGRGSDAPALVMPPSPALEVATQFNQAYRLETDEERLLDRGVVAFRENEPAASAFKVLRTRVLQRMRAKGYKTLVVTSPGENNGKTVTAVNLAVSMAGVTTQSVLLVDLDLRRPSVGGFFTDEPRPGLSDYLRGDASIGSFLIDPGLERLIILPGNKPIENSSEMLASAKMLRLYEGFKNRHTGRLVVFDMPPVLSGDDVITVLPHVDALILVVEDGRTRKDELRYVMDLLVHEKVDEKLLGTVLNGADEKDASGHIY